jgi:hypothetical protein
MNNQRKTKAQLIAELEEVTNNYNVALKVNNDLKDSYSRIRSEFEAYKANYKVYYNNGITMDLLTQENKQLRRKAKRSRLETIIVAAIAIIYVVSSIL